MKKTLALLLCLTFLLALASCSESSEKLDISPLTDTVGTFTVEDIAIIIEGKTFKANGDVKEVLEVLGENYEFSEAISCAYDGMDKKYTYENFDITTYPDGSIDRISEIAAYSGEASTAGGLKIGDTVEKMESIYGTGYYEAGITINYQIPAVQEGAEGALLYFTADDGIITSIAITAEILPE